MKKLDIYISELLYRSEKIVVPGFGAFIRQTARSLHDAHSHSVRPPRAVIGFNPHLSKDDGQLINYITQKERLSLEKVRQFIDGTVSLWQDSLRKSKEVKIERVGKIILSRNGQYRFVQQVGVNYNADTFGMPSSVLKPTPRGAGRAPSSSNNAKTSTQGSHTVKKQDSKTPLFLHVLMIAGFITLALIAAYYFFIRSFLNESEQAQLSLDNSKETQKAIVIEEDDDDTADNSLVEEAVTSEDSMESKPDAPASPAIEEPQQSLGENISKRVVRKNYGNYAIVIASAPSKIAAKRILTSLKDKGYESFIAGTIKKNGVQYFRIACSQFKSMKQAKIFRSKIRGEYPDAWITRLPKK